VARDWEISSTLADLRLRMDRFGDNVAPVPISLTMEFRDGKVLWCVDIHVKVLRQTEFDISTEGPTLSAALRAAYLGLNNEQELLRRASRANIAFGVAV
jgi:hypothetical protein